jgi:hypothetical protein
VPCVVRNPFTTFRKLCIDALLGLVLGLELRLGLELGLHCRVS